MSSTATSLNQVDAGKGAKDAALEAVEVVSFTCIPEVAKRIAKLYGDERLADVTFIVQQYEDAAIQKFVGHRNILSTWSEVLKGMLCGSFAESQSQEVHIRDVEPEAFEAMLKLMYCGTAEITFDNVLAILDVSVRFDVGPLIQFCVVFLQNQTSSEHACRMLEVGVQYNLTKLMDKCIELIVTDDHILVSEDFHRLPQTSIVELAKHDSWNMHEDEIYETMVRWASMNAEEPEEQATLLDPILEHIRYPHMSVEQLKKLSTSNEVPKEHIFDALFFKIKSSGQTIEELSRLAGRYRPRPGSLLFSWMPTSKITVSGDYCENARHTSSNGFTGVRGDRRMHYGVYSWTVNIAETQSSWIFVGVAQADDPNDVAWRSTGRMLYCLDSRYFHQGSGQNHPQGDRKIASGTCIRVTLDCTQHTLAFGIGTEKPVVLFRDMAPVAYVPAVDLRDCGDKVRLVAQPNLSSADSFARQQSEPPPGIQETASASAGENRRASAPGGPAAQEALGEFIPQPVPQPSQQEGGHGDPGVPSSNAFAPPSRHSLQPPSRHSLPPPSELPPRGRPLSSNEVHAALGIPHHPAGAGGSNARMSQPRQSQGSQGGGTGSSTVMNSDRMASLSVTTMTLEPLSLLEEEPQPNWEQQGLDLRNDMPPS